MTGSSRKSRVRGRARDFAQLRDVDLGGNAQDAVLIGDEQLAGANREARNL